MTKVRRLLETINMRQFFKFALVGFINTAVFYGIYFALLQLGFNYVIALTVGTVVGIVNSYLWNKIFTFRVKKKSLWESVKFFLVYGVQYLSNLLIIHICVSHIGISEELAGLLAISVGVFISYFGHKFWTFRGA
jgi:putative flippase GtrA